MFNLAEERPFHLQINIAAFVSVLILVFARLLRPETGGFGSLAHLASVAPLCVCWAVLVGTRRDLVFRLVGVLSILTCTVAFRLLLDVLEPHGDYWRFVVFVLILLHGAILFSRLGDYLVAGILCAAVSFIGLDTAYFTAAGQAEFAIASAATAVIGIMLNVIVMSSYRTLFAAKETYRRLSSTDPLTRLLNRRAFIARFAELQAAGGPMPMQLAMIDLDHFKQINDRHGHERGDAVLLAMAQALHRHVPGAAGRLGGEEFAVLLSDCSRGEARRRLDALLAEVRALDIEGIGITFSAGLVTAGPDEDVGHVLARADKALYRAKAEGRNRILCGDLAALPVEDLENSVWSDRPQPAAAG
jgi:diguanylate cyclase (GGDEF)-like protein